MQLDYLQNKKYKLLILDRDGVINFDSDEYIKSPEEWQAIPGSLEAIAKLNKLGIKVVVATNQAGVARKYFSIDSLKKIHRKMEQELRKIGGHIDDIFFCPHHPDDNCQCRKPEIGMLEEISAKYAISVENILLVGDSFKDILAANRFHCDAALVLTGKGKKTYVAHQAELENIAVFNNLAEVIVIVCYQK